MRKYNGRSTVLVTGGAGFLGSHLCDRLVAGGTMCRRCRASPPSACSRRWPAASRWFPRPGTTARYGFSPATRVFEAAGPAACLLSDAWEGLETFFEPGREVLVARSGDEVAQHVRDLDASRAREIGQAALRRVLSEHTYAHRAAQLDAVLEGCARAPLLEAA